jgi:hypothetical protein
MLLLTAALVAPMTSWADNHLPVNGRAEATTQSNVLARSSTSAPSFMATGNSNSSGRAPDNVSVAAAIPEQSNFALMFGAIAAIGFVARRRRPH